MTSDPSWDDLLKLAFILLLMLGVVFGPIAFMSWLERKERDG